MTRIVNTIGIAPKQEAPTNAPAQQTEQAQQTTQQPKVTANNPFGLSNAAKLGNTIYKFSNAGIWGAGTALGSATAGGAATGAVTAGGGTYVTGSGLAGSASAINTTAGAAGNIGKSSLAGGGMSGLATAGIGIITSAIGQNFFGGHGGTGASLGTAIGSIWGPVGAAIGGLFGGAIGGIFGGSEKRASVGVMQGGGGEVQANKYQKKFNTSLGSITVSTYNIPGEARNQIGKMFRDSDEQVASLLDEDQLARAKNGVLNTASTNRHTSWGKSGKSERSNGVFQQAFMDRYAAAMGGLDSNYQGTFKRVANDKNMGVVMGTMAQLDKDISNRYGVFQDFVPKEHGDLISDDDPRISKTIIGQVRGRGTIPYLTTQKVNNPQYDAKIAEQYRQQNADRQIVGWQEYKDLEHKVVGLGGKKWVQVTKYKPVYEDTRSAMGNQALDFLAEKYDLGTRPTAPKYKEVPELTKSPIGGGYMNTGSVSQAEKHNKSLRDSYNKKLGTWEKKVLDAYVDNYSQSVLLASANNLASLSSGITRESSEPAQVTRPQTGLLSQANTPTWEGGVQTHAAAPVNNDATNAGILRNRG